MDDRVEAFCRSFLSAGLDAIDDATEHRFLTGRAPERDFVLRLGDSLVRILLPSAAATTRFPLQDAFFACEASDDDQDWTLVVLDGEPPARVVWDEEYHYPLGQFSREDSGPYRIAIDMHSGSISVFDAEARVCVTWIPVMAAFPYWAAATPFRLQLSFFADADGWEFLHGAAIALANDVLVLGGPSRAGKSTFSTWGTTRGHRLISDDYFLIRDGSVQAIYRRFKLHADSWRVLSARLAEAGSPASAINADAPEEKRVFDLPGNLVEPLRRDVSVIALPRFGPRAQAEPLSRGRWLQEVSPHSLSGLLGGSPDSLKRISRFTSGQRTVLLSLEKDQDRNWDFVERDLFA